jgi:hypothetical protein
MIRFVLSLFSRSQELRLIIGSENRMGCGFDGNIFSPLAGCIATIRFNLPMLSCIPQAYFNTIGTSLIGLSFPPSCRPLRDESLDPEEFLSWVYWVDREREQTGKPERVVNRKIRILALDIIEVLFDCDDLASFCGRAF